MKWNSEPLASDATAVGKKIIAVCGKGGVGKTAFSALLARTLLDAGTKPLLLIDADPAGGLVSAVGERVPGTLAGVRETLIAAARRGGDAEKVRLAQQLDYLVMEALLERPAYSVLAMGRPREKGCFCPANTLLREAIDLVAGPFAAAIIDAEAGIEQIQREVTRRVDRVIAVTDGSRRSVGVLSTIAEMVGAGRVAAVANRVPGEAAERESELPKGVEILGAIPEDPELRAFDREGLPLWELPPENAAVEAVAGIAAKLRLGDLTQRRRDAETEIHGE